MTTVVCCGAATLDVLFRVAKIPTGPGKILPTAMLEVAHGMATSAAAAVSRLGGKGRLIARVGDDAAGERFVRDLTEAGVDCSIVRRVPGARSPLCTVLIDDAGDRLVVPYYDPALGRDVDWLPLAEVAAADAALVDVRWPEGAAAVLDTAEPQASRPSSTQTSAPQRWSSLWRAAPAMRSSPNRARWRSPAQLPRGRRSSALQSVSTDFLL